ncbi:2Fe-2S iron-sulfur cluster-binding protein [Thermodesulfobacteriota bacterium]
MPAINIDGIQQNVPEGTTILAAAKACGIWIPTLCHHEALTPYGGCRLCVVEATQNEATRITASCCTEASDQMIIKTDSQQLRRIRTFLVELLLAEAPEAPAVQKLARDLGAASPEWLEPRNELCIACGRCIRACSEIVGVSAIGFARRGYDRTAAAPFFRRSQECIGCGTCVEICPTGAVTLQDIPEGATGVVPDGEKIAGPARIMDNWKTGLQLKTCKTCGEPFAPQVQLGHITRAAGLPENFFDTCVSCRE